MKELKNFIIGSLVIPDATIQGLTGYTASDPRVYEWYPALDPVFSSTYPAYIIYRMVGYGRGLDFVDRGEVGDQFLHFDILAIDTDTTSDIVERMREILDLYGHFETESYRVLNLMVTEDFELPMEGESSSDRMFRHHLTVRLRGILKRGDPIGRVHYSSSSSESSSSASSSSSSSSSSS